MYDDGNISTHGDLIKGDNIFSNKFTMSNNYLMGFTLFNIMLQMYSTIPLISLLKILSYDNGKDQFAPVINDLNSTGYCIIII